MSDDINSLLHEKLVVKPRSETLNLGKHPDDSTPHSPGKERANEELELLRSKLELLQERLWAQGTKSLLVVLQGLDTAGKDGTIRKVFDGVNPQGVHVAGFKLPTEEEASHDYLWRVHRQIPAKGRIAIFNRSHYEDLIVPSVYGTLKPKEISARIHQVVEFESYLASQQVKVVKFFLHVSFKTQGERLEERLDMPDKHWKFSSADLDTRKHFSAFQTAYSEVLPLTSTTSAPWYIIPTRHKWYRSWAIMNLIVHSLDQLHPAIPKVTIENLASLRDELRTSLKSHKDDRHR